MASSPAASQTPGSDSATSASAPAQTSSSPDPKPNLYLENDPARTGFDPNAKWWMNYFSILTGRITREGAFHYRESRSRANEARDVERCEQDRDWLFAYSPTVRFLNDRIAELNHGRRLDASNVLCRRCPARLTPDGKVERQGGGFEPRHGIMVCSNEIRSRGHLEDILAHEMVHAYDELRFEVDFRGRKNLKQAACTEVGLCRPKVGGGGVVVERRL